MNRWSTNLRSPLWPLVIWSVATVVDDAEDCQRLLGKGVRDDVRGAQNTFLVSAGDAAGVADGAVGQKGDGGVNAVCDGRLGDMAVIAAGHAPGL